MIYNQIVTWTAFAILAMFVPERVVSKNMFVTTQKGAVTLNVAVPERVLSKNMFGTTQKGVVSKCKFCCTRKGS